MTLLMPLAIEAPAWKRVDCGFAGPARPPHWTTAPGRCHGRFWPRLPDSENGVRHHFFEDGVRIVAPTLTGKMVSDTFFPWPRGGETVPGAHFPGGGPRPTQLPARRGVETGAAPRAFCAAVFRRRIVFDSPESGRTIRCRPSRFAAPAPTTSRTSTSTCRGTS